MSSPKNSITSHSSYLWREAIVCFCLLSNPFSIASCPRLQTKGSVAPARSDETEAGFEHPAPSSAPLFNYKASKGNQRTRALAVSTRLLTASPPVAPVTAGGTGGTPRPPKSILHPPPFVSIVGSNAPRTVGCRAKLTAWPGRARAAAALADLPQQRSHRSSSGFAPAAPCGTCPVKPRVS